MASVFSFRSFFLQQSTLARAHCSRELCTECRCNSTTAARVHLALAHSILLNPQRHRDPPKNITLTKMTAHILDNDFSNAISRRAAHSEFIAATKIEVASVSFSPCYVCCCSYRSQEANFVVGQKVEYSLDGHDGKSQQRVALVRRWD